MNPELAIYNECWNLAADCGYKVFQTLPREGVKVDYPFIHVESSQLLTNRSSKEKLSGRVSIIISVWGQEHQRGTVAHIGSSLYEKVSNTTNLEGGLTAQFLPSRSLIQILPDTTTNEILWRARMLIEFNFN